MEYTLAPVVLHSLDDFMQTTVQAMLQETIWCSKAVWDRCYSTFGELIYGYWRRYYVVIIFQPPADTTSLLPISILWHIWCVYQPLSI